MPAAPEVAPASETRERLLATAETMFAVQGYEATSVREITEAAGANVAAVSYYFGGKEGLYRAVFHRVLDEMRERRISRIEADLDAAGDGMTLEGFLASFAEAFVEPLVEGERSRNFIALFDQEMRIGLFPTHLFLSQLVQPMIGLFRTSLERVGCKVDEITAAQCLMSAVGQLAHLVKVSRKLSEEGEQRELALDLGQSMPHFIRFTAAGIRACEAASRQGGASA